MKGNNMSMIRCSICDQNIDSDFVDCTVDENGDMCCEKCLEERHENE